MPDTPFQPELPQGTATEWSSTAHLQTRWDWRAVGNFIGGGTGAGLLLAALLLAPSVPAYRVQAAAGLAVVALGLLCILAKMGRPTRAFNIFRHGETSWMTREGFAMPTLFGGGFLSLGAPEVGAPAVVATLSALFFLYCQARILAEAKGIPAWAEPRIVPLIIVTGLAEGIGLAALCAAVVPGRVSLPLAGLLLGTLVLRHGVWRGYQRSLQAAQAPRESIEVLGNFGRYFEPWGQWLPAGLLAVGFMLGESALTGLAAAAGLLAVAAGWAMKYTIFTRAGFYYRKSFSLSAMMAQGRSRA